MKGLSELLGSLLQSIGLLFRLFAMLIGILIESSSFFLFFVVTLFPSTTGFTSEGRAHFYALLACGMIVGHLLSHASGKKNKEAE